MIGVRPARAEDAAAIGAVHVAAWRSAYPGILPDAYLAGLSAVRQARHYAGLIDTDGLVFVAAPGKPRPGAAPLPRIVGFASAGPARPDRLAEGEIYSLYVLDDFRDHGLGRDLMRAAAQALADRGCRSAFVWVLRDNPSRFFYRHLGGHEAAHGETRVGGVTLAQTAFVWDPIEKLLGDIGKE